MSKVKKRPNVENMFKLTNDSQKLVNVISTISNNNDPNNSEIRKDSEYKKALEILINNEEDVMSNQLKFLASYSNFKMNSIKDFLNSIKENKSQTSAVINHFTYLK